MKNQILVFLWGIALIAYLQRAVISVPLQEIGRDLALEEPTLSLGRLQFAWYLGYALMQLPTGRLADKIGARKSLVLLSILWSIATAVTAFSQNFTQIMTAWALMGMLQAGIFPCAVRTVSQIFGGEERARASGWLGAGSVAGGAIAPFLTAALLKSFGEEGTLYGVQGWRVCLIIFSLPGFLWAIAYWFNTREFDPDRLTKQGASTSQVNNPVSAQTSTIELWAQMLRDRSLLLLCGQQFLRAAAMVFFITWFPTFLREARGVTLFDSGIMTTCTGLAAMLGIISGGYISDAILIRTGRRRIARQGIAVLGMSICALLIVISFFVENVYAAIALISFGAFSASFGGVAGYTVAIEYGGERVGVVFGAMNMCGNFGSMLFPETVGRLVKATGTWNSALVLFAVLMAVDAVLWLLLNPKHQFMAKKES